MSRPIEGGLRDELVAVVLAAGKGTRMRSRRPKVAHEVAGKPMLRWVLEAARGAGCERIVAVVGPEAREGEAEPLVALVGSPEPAWVVQEERRGTGHALLSAAEALAGYRGPLLVLSGDTPLLTAATLAALHAAAAGRWGALAVAELDHPGSLGRALCRPDGTLERIVEAADASPAELAVRRVNAGLYLLPAPEIFAELSRLSPDNAQGEIYLTDALGAAAGRGETIAALELADPAEAWGVNNRAELARAHRLLLDRHLEALLAAGVTVLEPGRTVVEPTVTVEADAVLHPGVTLLGQSRVGEGAVLSTGAWVRDSTIGAGAWIGPYVVLEGVRVAAGERVSAHAQRIGPAGTPR
jgi:bifunctional UDP-N-acetylglucosamine pyrophosphorylase/glucosamine-1-phosphate N-acetyltransferase